MPYQAKFYRFGANRFFVGGVALTLIGYTLEGPLRHALQLAGMETLLYLRDVFALVCVMLVLAGWAAGQANAFSVAAASGILIAHTCIALISLPPFQALFGLKIFLPFMLGLIVAPLLATERRTIVRFAALTLCVTVLGVLLNDFVEFPWIGSAYETAFGSTSISRQWWVEGGTRRLPGFARASYDAASFALLALVPLIVTPMRLPTKALLIGICGYTVVLTTSKGPLLALPAMLLELILAHAFGSAVASAYLMLLGAVCLAVPLIAVHVHIGTAGLPSILDSFMERVLDMWPQAFALLEHPIQVLCGRGIGGIGVAQAFGDWAKDNSADNVMVYLLVSCGVLGPIYVGGLLFKLHALLGSRPRADFTALCAGGWTALWLANGITANMIEEPAMNLVIGLVSGLTMAQRLP